MLKKVMIICIAFSFVFIGGIAFAAGGQPEPPQEGQTVIPELEPISGDVTAPAEPTDLTTDDPETVTTEGDELKEEQQQEETKEGGDVQE